MSVSSNRLSFYMRIVETVASIWKEREKREKTRRRRWNTEAKTCFANYEVRVSGLELQCQQLLLTSGVTNWLRDLTKSWFVKYIIYDDASIRTWTHYVENERQQKLHQPHTRHPTAEAIYRKKTDFGAEQKNDRSWTVVQNSLPPGKQMSNWVLYSYDQKLTYSCVRPEVKHADENIKK